jgi:hypothetical protein
MDRKKSCACERVSKFIYNKLYLVFPFQILYYGRTSGPSDLKLLYKIANISKTIINPNVPITTKLKIYKED